MKRLIIFSFVLLILGGFLSVSGAVAGGYQESQRRFSMNHASNWPSEAWDRFFDSDIWEGAPAISSNSSSPSSGTAAIPEYVTDLDLTLSGGNFELLFTEDDALYYHIQSENTAFDSFEEGFYEDEDSITWKLTLKCASNTNSDVQIYLPMDVWYEECKIQLDIGELITSGTLQADELDVTVGLGTVTLAADLFESVDFNVGMGSATLLVYNPWSDFSYDMKCGAGSITVDGEDILSGIGKVSRDHGAIDLDVNVGMGNFEMRTNHELYADDGASYRAPHHYEHDE